MNKKNLFFAVLFILFSTIAYASRDNLFLGKTSENIEFKASDVFPDTNLTNAFWDFADDTEGQGIAINHSFQFAGVYNMTVNATDINGAMHFGRLTSMIGGVVPYARDGLFVAISFSNTPDGIFQVTIEQNDSTNTPTSGYLVGGKFLGITSDMPNGAFSADLQFSYLDEDDNGIVDNTNIDENSLSLYFYDNGWVLVPNAIKNTNANLITAAVNHFTLFALMAPAPSGGSSGGSSGGGGGGGGGSGSGGGGGGGAAGFVCNMDWKCGEWGDCVNGIQTRDCNFIKVPQHVQDTQCPASGNSPATSQKCELKKQNITPAKTTVKPANLSSSATFTDNVTSSTQSPENKAKINLKLAAGIAVLIAVIAGLAIFVIKIKKIRLISSSKRNKRYKNK